eukprot:GFUD01125902.1.p1 GENE.GFUD01125902.1~~GFUD01125902.1.p1  ORF type:complete len:185 (+),score=47.59 GFUD01125902.1:118-672(+)
MALESAKTMFRTAYSKHLLATNIIASGGLLMLGDVIQQNIELYRGLHRKGTYDWNRSGKMLLIGLFHGAPRHYFYVYLERFIPGKTITCAAKKVFIDQTVISVFVDSTFLYGISIMEEQTPAQAWRGLQDKFLQVYLCDWILWPPAQMLNFTLVPPRFRVLFVNVTNLAWSTILSYFQHQYQAK